MIEAHAARSIEEGSACARTPVAGPGVTRKMDVVCGCSSCPSQVSQSSRLISGRQTELERYRSLPGSWSQTEYISLYWKPASRLKSSARNGGVRHACGAQGDPDPAQRCTAVHLPSPRPMSHPCLNDRRAGRPGSPRTQGRQRGQHPAGLRGVRYIYPGTTPLETECLSTTCPMGVSPSRKEVRSKARSFLREVTSSSDVKSQGSQSVSALHLLLLAFEQGASAAGHRFGDRAAASVAPHWPVSILYRAALPGLALSARRTTSHQVSRDCCSASLELCYKIFAKLAPATAQSRLIFSGSVQVGYQ
jgi:hypothetical protein